MTIAAWKGHVPVVRVLLEESVKAKCKVNKYSMVGCGLVEYVCLNGYCVRETKIGTTLQLTYSYSNRA